MFKPNNSREKGLTVVMEQNYFATEFITKIHGEKIISHSKTFFCGALIKKFILLFVRFTIEK